MLSWFFEYAFPIIFIVMFVVIILNFISISFYNFSFFRSFRNRKSTLPERLKDNLEMMKSVMEVPMKSVKISKDYTCKNCGAILGEKADVSPSGDVKCQYCNKWFNIHKN
jgi:DNA-directed RNA polymerase subunit RPC12/RpoP